MLARSASVASAMFVTRSRSRSAVGNGTTIITTMPTIAAGIAICPMRLGFTELRASQLRAVRGRFVHDLIGGRPPELTVCPDSGTPDPDGCAGLAPPTIRPRNPCWGFLEGFLDTVLGPG